MIDAGGVWAELVGEDQPGCGSRMKVRSTDETAERAHTLSRLPSGEGEYDVGGGLPVGDAQAGSVA